MSHLNHIFNGGELRQQLSGLIHFRDSGIRWRKLKHKAACASAPNVITWNPTPKKKHIFVSVLILFIFFKCEL